MKAFNLSLHERQSLAALRVICTMAGEGGEDALPDTWSHPNVLEPIMKGGNNFIEWVTMEGWNREHWGSQR